MRNGNRSLGLLVPLALAGGWAAGAVSARHMVRREIEKLRALLAPPPRPAEPAPAVAAPLLPAPVEEEEISEETLMVLSAAVAAFLGKRARVRAVRMVRPGTSPWAQEGRVSIQASHALVRQ